MAIIIGIEPNDDQVLRYCRAFRQAYVYSHPTLASTRPVHALVTCFDTEANPVAIDVAVRTPGVRFVTGSGHGLYDRYTGVGGVTIWDTATARPHRIAGMIIHLLSCQAGGLLGRLLVQQGASAF